MKRMLIWLLCISLLFTLPVSVGGAEYQGASQGLAGATEIGAQQSQPLSQGNAVLQQGEETVTQFAQQTVATTDTQSDVTTPVFWVESLTAQAGETRSLSVRVNNNPGIVSAKLALSYDTNVLEGVSVVLGDFPEVSFGPVMESPWIFNFMDAINPNNATNGVLATVTFKIKETASVGEYPLTLSYNPADVFDYNLSPVSFDLVQGSVTVVDYLPGDVNSDGELDNKDLSLLLRYLNRWMVEIHHNAADVNGDGEINNIDFCLLQRYLNGWDVTLSHGNYLVPNVESLRVATYNIRALQDVSGDPAAIADYIRANNLELVGLQEVDINTGRGGCTLHQAKALAEELGWYWGYSKAINLYTGEYGTGIVSKYPIASYTTTRLVSTGEEQRVMGHAVVTVGEKTVNFLNVHLSYQSQLPNQLAQIQEYVAGLDNFILVGDFNCSDFEALSKLGGRLVNSHSSTFVTNEDGAIDNIIVKGHTAGAGTMVENVGSDHNMLYADITLCKPPEAVTTLRAATYHINALANVNGDPTNIVNLIVNNNLDVVSLQAVDNNTGRNNNSYHQAKEIATRLGWHWGYSPCVSLNGGEYGTAILSKYPMESYKSIQLDSAGEENRLLGHAVIDVAGQKINVLNSHLSYQSKLATQVAQVAEYAKSLDNFIMPADFNTEDFNLISQISGNMANNYSNKMITHPQDGAVDNILTSPFAMDQGVKVDNSYSVHAMVYADVHLNQAANVVTSLRVGTYNIHYLSKTAGDATAIADFLASKNLDVVGLQEVDKNVGRDGPVQDQAKVLAEQLGWYYGYSKAISLGSGEYGNAILSKYPIVSYQTVSLSSSAEEQRVMGHGVIQVGGQLVNVLNTHLSFQEMNQTQITQIKNYVASLDAYILTGDFSTSNFLNLAQIDGKMINNLQTPFQTSLEDGAVDNIFVKSYGATPGVMAQSEYSDHYLLYTAVNLFPSVNKVNGLRVGTYNIRHLADVGGDATVIANFILENNLDVVGLQEVDNNVGRDGPAQNQVKAIAEALGWYWGFSKAIDLSGGEYGHGIISKYPIEAYSTFALQSGSEEGRAMGHAVLNVAGTKLNFLNVHLSWQEMTGTQITQVANHAKGYGKYIVVGDFNAEYDELTPIAGTMVNNASDRFVTNVEDGAIDNIIVNGMSVGKGTMVESSYSDHSMLYADVKF